MSLTERSLLVRAFGPEAVAFSPEGQALYRLDPTSTLIWREARGRARLTPSRLARLASRLGRTPEVTAAAVSDLAATLDALGAPGSTDACEPCREVPRARPGRSAPAEGALVLTLAGARMAVACADTTVRAALEVLAGRAAIRARACVPVDIAFSIEGRPGAWRLVGPRGAGPPLADPEAVRVAFKAEALDALLALRPGRFAIHAAVLAGPHGGIVVAGASGRGKSTLAAVLESRGLPLVADDVAFVSAASHLVRGLPFAFALKTGSWDLLARSASAASPPAVRPDGRTVRYLPARRIASAARGVSHLVFPRFAPGAPTRALARDPISAIAEVLSEARSAAGRLSAAEFTRLADLVARAHVLDLAYGCAEDAADALIAGLHAPSSAPQGANAALGAGAST